MVGTGSWVNCESYIDDEDERAASDRCDAGRGYLSGMGVSPMRFQSKKHGRDAHATEKFICSAGEGTSGAIIVF